MSAQHYIDEAGAYIGGFDGGAQPPAGAIPVPFAPPDARCTWTGTAWASPPSAPRGRADVLADLAVIDAKSIRALRENNAARIAELEAQAQALRQELAALA